MSNISKSFLFLQKLRPDADQTLLSNEFGELLPGDCFTQAEMRTYLFNNPTNFKKGTFKPKEG